VLLDGKVYIGGGSEAGRIPSYRIDVYTPASNSWSSSPIITPCYYFAMTTLNEQLIIAGGKDRSNKMLTNKIFSLNGSQLKEYTMMITPRCNATAAGHKGTLMVVGGVGDHNRLLATTELFDTITGHWCNATDLPVPHCGLKSVIVDNTVFLLRGRNKEGVSLAVFTAPLDTLSSHQLKWNYLLVTPWCNSAPVSINGNLLILGGYNFSSGHTNNIYIFNKASQSWEVIGKIPSARSVPAAVSIDDNKIVVVGGLDDSCNGGTNTVWIGSCESQ